MKPSAAATINMGLVHDNSDGFHGQWDNLYYICFIKSSMLQIWVYEIYAIAPCALVRIRTNVFLYVYI
jgi:hypothetical protein